MESSLCTSPQDKVDKELDGQEEIGFSVGWNIRIQILPNASSYVNVYYIYTYIIVFFNIQSCMNTGLIIAGDSPYLSVYSV